MKKIIKMLKKLGKEAACLLLCLQWGITNVYAAGIGSSKLFTGTKKLLNDMKTPLIGISGVAAVIVIIYLFIRMKFADEMDAKMYKKRIMTVLACAIGVVLIASLLTVILSYYK